MPFQPHRVTSTALPDTPPILHLFAGSVPGGVLRYVIDIAQAAREQGTPVVLAGQRGDWHHQVEQAGLEWVDLPIRGRAVDLWRCSSIASDLIRRRGIRLIHAHHRRATLVGRLAQRRCPHLPMLYTLHLTDMPMSFPWRLFSSFGDHCHAPSEQARRWLIGTARVPPGRINLIPHGVHVERFPRVTPELRAAARASLDLPSDALVLAYVGRLEEPKNESWCLDVLAQNAAHLVVAGDGPNRAAFEDRARHLALTARVRLLGDCDPLPVYHAADLLLLPSSREGFSYACAEAMCCGIPVLRTHTAGTEEMILPGVTGRSCPVDQGAFRAAAREMLADAASLPRLGRAAAEHVRNHLTFVRQVEQTLALYRQLTHPA